MNQTVQTDNAGKRVSDEELIGVLTAISVVAKRLAKNLTLLTKQSQSNEGGKSDEQNERTGRRDRGTA